MKTNPTLSAHPPPAGSDVTTQCRRLLYASSVAVIYGLFHLDPIDTVVFGQYFTTVFGSQNQEQNLQRKKCNARDMHLYLILHPLLGFYYIF